MKTKQSIRIAKNRYVKHILFLITAIVFCTSGYSQVKELSWEELRDRFECPLWFSEAKFGIWAHWGCTNSA